MMDTSNYPSIKSAKGVWLKLKNGVKILDFTSGATVTNIGHGNRKIAKSIYKQFIILDNCYFYDNTPRSDYRTLLLKALNAPIKNPFYEDAIFLTSGSESIDCAIKTAISFSSKTKIISTFTSFHGRTLNCMSLTKLPFADIWHPKDPHRLLFNYPKNKTEEAQSLSNLMKILKKNSNEIAALILEPYQGDGGLFFPSPKFFQQISSICKKNDVLFILDEIQSAFGRTGSLFYFHQIGIIPDILCLGKAMANGIPCSAMVTTKEILKNIRVDHISSSFGGNPISKAAAIEVLNFLKSNNFIKSLAAKERAFLSGLTKLRKTHSAKITDIRGKGLIFGIDLNPEKDTRIGYKFVASALQNGILLMPPKGKLKNIIKISPPLIITTGEIRQSIHILDTVLKEL